ncbi:MAG: hypothetical protein ACYC7A_13190 [Thermoanaerobaculia bacterium]
MARLLTLVFILLAPGLLAGPLPEFTLIETPRSVETGATFQIRATITNTGDAAIQDMSIYLGLFATPSSAIVAMEVPGAACLSAVGQSYGYCDGDRLAPGATRTVVITAIAPMALGTIHGELHVGTREGWQVETKFSIAVTAAPRDSDVALSIVPKVVSDGRYRFAVADVTVTNHGSFAVRPVLVTLRFWQGVYVTAAGPEWVCSRGSRGGLCSRSNLNPGESSTIRVTSAMERVNSWTYADVYAHVRDTDLFDNAAQGSFTAEDFPYTPVGVFEPVLLPISIYEWAGGHGSIWKSELSLFNENDFPLIFGQNVFHYFETGCLFPMCPTPATVFPSTAQNASYIERLEPGPPGVMLHLAKELVGGTLMNLRLRDISRQSLTAGVEIPVVREHEFETERIILANVPTDARFRTMLRIYDPDARTEARVRVRVFALGSETPLGEGDLTLHVEQGGEWLNEMPLRPGYAQVSNLESIAPTIAEHDRIRIDIEPLTPDLRFWAFVSITNNETQHVTLVTPQPGGSR